MKTAIIIATMLILAILPGCNKLGANSLILAPGAEFAAAADSCWR